MKHTIYFSLGCVTFVLGTVGVFVPILPTVPFYLATSFLWLRSSPKAHAYLIETTWYKKYIQELIVEKQMKTTQLLGILAAVFFILLIPFILVPNTVMRISLIIVFLGHCIFFPLYFNKKQRLNHKSSQKSEIKS